MSRSILATFITLCGQYVTFLASHKISIIRRSYTAGDGKVESLVFCKLMYTRRRRRR